MSGGGFVHSTGLFGSDEEFVHLVIPFLADGLEAGDPVAVAFTENNQNVVHEVFGDRVIYVDARTQYDRPAGTIRRSRELFSEHVAAGAKQIRMAGDVPADRVSWAWDWWVRYEAAVNDLYSEFPVWAMCVYDTRTTPESALAEVRRTHPYLAVADGHTANPAFEDPRTFLQGRHSGWRDPMELSPATMELRDPGAAAVRQAIRTFTTDLTSDELNGLLLGASEVVTNAIDYGLAPVTVQLWASPRRIVVAVRDQGPGPADPYVGLRPAPGAPTGGMGLWLAHQLCTYVDMAREPDGFTVRLVAGDAD